MLGSAHTAPWPDSPSPGRSYSAESGCASASWSQWLPGAQKSVAGDMTRFQLAEMIDNKTIPNEYPKTIINILLFLRGLL